MLKRAGMLVLRALLVLEFLGTRLSIAVLAGVGAGMLAHNAAGSSNDTAFSVGLLVALAVFLGALTGRAARLVRARRAVRPRPPTDLPRDGR